jgi:lipopolysaccharide export system protein LptC
MFQRFWRGKAACLAAAVSILAAPGCRAAKPGETKGVVPELKLEGVRFRVYRGDALRAHGDAETASLRRDSSDVRASQVFALLPRDGEPVRITAATGEGSLATRVFEASGGMTVARGDDIARTERARYEPQPGEGLVRGDLPVVVEGRGYRLEGTGFTLDPASGTVVVRGGARLVAGIGDER